MQPTMTVAEAVKKFGTRYHIAKVLRITESAVSRWGAMVPQHRVSKLLRHPGGRLKRGGLRK